MRHSLSIAALTSFLLAACASSQDLSSRNVSQSGTLKVHPGLLGQPVPPELQPQEETTSAPAAKTDDKTTN